MHVVTRTSTDAGWWIDYIVNTREALDDPDWKPTHWMLLPAPPGERGKT